MNNGNFQIGDNYSIKKVNDLSEFEKLKTAWDNLAEKQGSYMPFLCFDWFKIWFKNFLDANQLMILLLYEKGRIAGIAPFLVTREKFKSIPVSKIELIGNVYSPIRGVIFAESELGNKKIYLNKIINYFFKDFREWDVIDLYPISSEDENGRRQYWMMFRCPGWKSEIIYCWGICPARS